MQPRESGKWRDILERKARSLLGEDPVHGWPHVERVLENAIRICESEEGCDEDIVIAAVLLHDVGRAFEATEGRHHALISAERAPSFLEEAGFPRDKIQQVVDAILSHSYSLGTEPRSLEACIVRDADRLDAMGAVGIARAFMEGMRRGRGIKGTLEHFKEKLLLLRDGLCTTTGKRMGEERHSFMKAFLKQFCYEAPSDCRAVGLDV